MKYQEKKQWWCSGESETVTKEIPMELRLHHCSTSIIGFGGHTARSSSLQKKMAEMKVKRKKKTWNLKNKKKQKNWHEPLTHGPVVMQHVDIKVFSISRTQKIRKKDKERKIYKVERYIRFDLHTSNSFAASIGWIEVRILHFPIFFSARSFFKRYFSIQVRFKWAYISLFFAVFLVRRCHNIIFLPKGDIQLFKEKQFRNYDEDGQ